MTDDRSKLESEIGTALCQNDGTRMSIANIRTGKRPAPDRVLVIGVEGVGKSSWSAGAPSPIYIAAEDGIRELDVASFPEPRSFAEILEAIERLRADAHDYKTVVIDTADWVEPLIVAHVCADRGWMRNGKPDIEQPGYGKGWVATVEEWRRLVTAIEALRAERSMGAIVLAHAAIKSFANPIGPDYARYETKLAKGAAALLKEWADTILFATYEEYTTKENKGARPKGLSTGRRVAKTERSAAWDAKNRYGLPPELPFGLGAWPDYERAREAGRSESGTALLEEADRLIDQLTNRAKADQARAYIDANTNFPERLASAVDRLRTLLENQP